MAMHVRHASIVSLQQRLHNSRGFSLLELVVVVIIFSILLGVLLQRLAFYQEEAELAQIQLLEKNMRVALNSRVYAAMTSGETRKMHALAGSNPINLLASRPENYLGELDSSAVKSVAAGHWYFDRVERKLVYVFSSKKSFHQDSYERRSFRLEFSRIPTGPKRLEKGDGLDGSLELIKENE